MHYFLKKYLHSSKNVGVAVGSNASLHELQAKGLGRLLHIRFNSNIILHTVSLAMCPRGDKNYKFLKRLSAF